MSRRRAGLLLALAVLPLAVLPLAARADERTEDERLVALARQLKSPEGLRASYKLVDAGPAALNDLLNVLGTSPLADERIEACLREIALTREGAKELVDRLSRAARPLSRARLARALALARATEAIYPIVDAMDSPQEPLEVTTYGPHGARALDTVRIAHPVSAAAASFGEKAVPAIRKRLAKSTSALFRVEAAWALGVIKSPEAVPDLVALASAEERTASERSMALQALAAMGTPAGRDAFAKALASEEASVRRAGLRGLAAVPDPSAVPQVARMLETEKDDDVRLDEVKALAAAEDVLAAGPLEAALLAAGSARDSVRIPLVKAAADGLGRTGDRGAPAALLKALEGPSLGFAADHAIAETLSRIPDLGVTTRERLRTIVEEKRLGETTRACCAWVLAMRGEDGPLAALVAAARSNEWAVRASVATLLGEGKLDGAVPVLLALTQDKEAGVRRAAATALGKSEDSHAGAALVAAAPLAQDPETLVRRAYALSFQDALPQGTVEPQQRKDAAAVLARALESELANENLEDRRALASTLARLGERAALLRVASGALVATPPSESARRAAIECLAGLGRHEATEQALLGLVKDPVAGDDAALALARIRGERFFEPQWRAILAPPVPFH